MEKLEQSIDKVAEWHEWPLLGYFMLHFFPPFPAALPNLCLLLAAIGILTKYRGQFSEAFRRLNHPVAWLWLLLVGLLGVSIFQAPEGLRAESWHRFISDLGKGTLFGAVLLLHLDHPAKARRLLIAASVGASGMLFHFLYTTWLVVQETGKFPLQRDYLYWLLLYFPFALAAYIALPHSRYVAALAVVGTVVLAVSTGFRGAMLSLAIMFLAFAITPKIWRLLVAGVLIAAVGISWLSVKYPEQGMYTLAKLQQTTTSGRVESHWLPAWELALEKPWSGHGYGHRVFGHDVNQGLTTHPGWLRPGMSLDWMPASPHSITFEVLFAAGFPALLVLLLLFAAALRYLIPPLWRSRLTIQTSEVTIFTYSALVSLIGSYIVFAQFETPAWCSLPVLIGLALGGLQLIEHNKHCVRTQS